MNTALKLDPIISEFETQQEADSYDAWFRAKVEEGLKCEKAYPHDEVLQMLRERRTGLIKQC